MVWSRLSPQGQEDDLLQPRNYLSGLRHRDTPILSTSTEQGQRRKRDLPSQRTDGGMAGYLNSTCPTGTLVRDVFETF